MEALRRLRRGAASTSVDRRLVTNVLLTFLCTPREDTKRFEMLGLLASILSWSDDERVRAGLQRMGNNPSSANSPVRSRAMELEKTDETEVCSPAPAPGMALKSFLVVLPSLGGVSSFRSTVGRPIVYTHAITYTPKLWAFPTYTTSWLHYTSTSITEGQGACVRSDMTNLGDPRVLHYHLPLSLLSGHFWYFDSFVDLVPFVYFLPLIVVLTMSLQLEPHAPSRVSPDIDYAMVFETSHA